MWYLGLDDAVHDRLQCFQFVALHDSFKVLGPVSESLSHRHVQVVVGFLCSQVLFSHTETQTDSGFLTQSTLINRDQIYMFTHDHVKLGVDIHHFTCRHTHDNTFTLTHI